MNSAAYEECRTSNAQRRIRELPAEGLEPTRPRGHWILSPARLPIPPRRLTRLIGLCADYFLACVLLFVLLSRRASARNDKPIEKHGSGRQRQTSGKTPLSLYHRQRLPQSKSAWVMEARREALHADARIRREVCARDPTQSD